LIISIFQQFKKELKMKKGFTLIELLVVIAIIGLLSAVVFASLNSARGKGANAAIKANLANAYTKGEMIYDATGSYAPVCSDSIIGAMKAAAEKANGGTAGYCGPTSATDAWVLSVPLKVAETGGASWCIDSTGAAKAGAAPAANATVCP
jgi:prepilin-type N-terminal cleavage/methylation domain-containing protein